MTFLARLFRRQPDPERERRRGAFQERAVRNGIRPCSGDVTPVPRSASRPPGKYNKRPFKHPEGR